MKIVRLNRKTCFVVVAKKTFLFLSFKWNFINQEDHYDLSLKKTNEIFCDNKEILSIKYEYLNKKIFYRHIFKNKRSKEKWPRELCKQKAASVSIG